MSQAAAASPLGRWHGFPLVHQEVRSIYAKSAACAILQNKVCSFSWVFVAMRLLTLPNWLRVAIVSILACVATPTHAETLRWPAATYLPKPAPAPAPPPAFLERPAATTMAAKATQRTATTAPVCREGRVCVICVAACDFGTPAVVQSLQPRAIRAVGIASSTVENNSDGVAANAPRFARQDWAGIACGTESGCRVSGISAPPRSRSIDVYISVSRPTVGGANSWYIDGP
jgi:hypothetical protein